MTLRRGFGLIFILTLVVYALALARPELFLGSFDYLVSLQAKPSDTTQSDIINRVTIEPERLDLAAITFPETVPEDDGAALPLQSNGDNHITIPAMGVNAPIIESDSDKALWQGVWRIPGSAVPGTNGNIVLVAHRWLHKPPHPETFYLIDKLMVGDPLYYDYKGTRYEYRVTKTFVVDPDDIEILQQDENKLTLFTCTPLYSTKQRYVVTAELVRVGIL